MKTAKESTLNQVLLTFRQLLPQEQQQVAQKYESIVKLMGGCLTRIESLQVLRRALESCRSLEQEKR